MKQLPDELAQSTRQRTLAGFPKPARVLCFLREWANVREEYFGQLARRYPEFHPASFESPSGRVHAGIPENWTKFLQAAWREPDTKWKTLMLARLLPEVMGTAAGHRTQWAENIGIALVGALQNAERLFVCSNPECPAPLTIRKRKNQGQCSRECAAWAQRNWKRAWWTAHGEKWRQNLKKKPRRRRTC